MGTRLASPATWPATWGDGSQCGPSSAYRALHNFSPHIFPIKRHLDTNHGLAAGLLAAQAVFPASSRAPEQGWGERSAGAHGQGLVHQEGRESTHRGSGFPVCLSVCLHASLHSCCWPERDLDSFRLSVSEVECPQGVCTLSQRQSPRPVGEGWVGWQGPRGAEGGDWPPTDLRPWRVWKTGTGSSCRPVRALHTSRGGSWVESASRST